MFVSGLIWSSLTNFQNDDGPYQSAIGFNWFLLNVITGNILIAKTKRFQLFLLNIVWISTLTSVSILVYGEFFGVEPEHRYKKLCYYVVTLTLCGFSHYFSAHLFASSLPYHRKDVHPSIHILWIVGVIIYNAINIHNHLVLIYDTITEVIKHQWLSLYNESFSSDWS